MLTMLLLAPGFSLADKPVTLGEIHIKAWLAQPQMPPIAISRGPLLQIIERVNPPRARPAAREWEREMHRHRRLSRAAQDALDELERHFEHQLLLHTGNLNELKKQWSSQRQSLEERYERQANDRMKQIQIRETEVTQMLRHSNFAFHKNSFGPAAAKLLLAEMKLARKLNTLRTATNQWREQKRLFNTGQLTRLPAQPKADWNDLLRRLKQVTRAGADRMIRERVAQLLAICLTQQGNLNQAAQVLQDALARNVSWTMEPELQNRLGDLLLEQGHFAQASHAYGAISQSPGSWGFRARLGLAWTRHRLGDDTTALAAINDIRKQLAGLFDSDALNIATAANRLFVHLLAEQDTPLPANLSPRIRDIINALRASFETSLTKTAYESWVAKDGRFSAIKKAHRKFQKCYRTLLATHPDHSGRAVVYLHAGRQAITANLSFGNKHFERCLNQAAKGVESLPNEASAVVILRFYNR
ncbi:MAG TPA: hypothetical protein EYN66_09560 [Myxococcales bacterium]|nr:hypothetical protein [Myxococcales bacterium]